MIRSFPVVALFAMACAPQSATMTEGQMWGFMSESTSFSLISGELEIEDAEENWAVDCRVFEDNDPGERIEDALDICDDPVEVRPGVTLNWPPARERWLNRGAFRAFTEPMDPWRGQGFMTFEGDLQVGFHTRVPGGEDFRFQFAIDPTFGPTRCTQEGENVVAEAIDGDWIGEWSKEIEVIAARDDNPEFLQNAADDFTGGKLYFLNARSFQFNPQSTDETWSIPQEWQAGFAGGSFIDEDLRGRPSRYAEPSAYAAIEEELGTSPQRTDIWYSGCGPEEPSADCPAHQIVTDQAADAALDSMDDMLLASPSGTAPFFRPLDYANTWRPNDGRPPGLDGWATNHYSWVMISSDSTMEVGGTVTGAFQIYFDGLDSQSRIFVQGRFEVPKVKKDNWGGTDLKSKKLEENGIELCIR